MSSDAALELTVKADGESRALRWRPLADGRVEVLVGGEPRTFEAQRMAPGRWLLRSGTAQVLVEVDARFPKGTASVSSPDGEPRAVALELMLPAAIAGAGRAAGGEAQGPLTLRAMMPGRVVKVLVQQGQTVRAGQALLVVEAMKMQNDLLSPRDAKVLALHCAEGAAVEAQQELVSLG